jgi:hypothetical protein
MSTLQEALQHRRAAEPPADRSCDSANEPVRSLQIHAWAGDKWVLPWAQFSFAHHAGSGDNERLVLFFANHEVILEGARLAMLLPEIAGFRLDCLRDMPPKFRAQAEKGEPFISRLVVRDITDGREGDGQTS